jgi:hypothetical protein
VPGAERGAAGASRGRAGAERRKSSFLGHTSPVIQHQYIYVYIIRMILYVSETPTISSLYSSTAVITLYPVVSADPAGELATPRRATDGTKYYNNVTISVLQY